MCIRDRIVNTPQKYSALTGVEVRTGKEAVALDAEKKQVTVQDVQTGEKEVCSYDRSVSYTHLDVYKRQEAPCLL